MPDPHSHARNTREVIWQDLEKNDSLTLDEEKIDYLESLVEMLQEDVDLLTSRVRDEND